jgi:hypothetical protein
MIIDIKDTPQFIRRGLLLFHEAAAADDDRGKKVVNMIIKSGANGEQHHHYYLPQSYTLKHLFNTAQSSSSMESACSKSQKGI